MADRADAVWTRGHTPINPEDLPAPSAGLPMPAGTSGFHIKGASYRAIMTHVENGFPGGVAELARRLPGEDLQQFASQQFLAASWYDILPSVPITRLLAEQAGHRYFEWVRVMAERIAVSDSQGRHRLLLAGLTPREIFERTAAIHKQYTDFGDLTIEQVGRSRARTIRSGVPEFLVPWIYAITIGFAGGLMPGLRKRAGGITILSPVAGERIYGLPTVTIAVEYAW
jgi:hypothetical protein